MCFKRKDKLQQKYHKIYGNLVASWNINKQDLTKYSTGIHRVGNISFFVVFQII